MLNGSCELCQDMEQCLLPLQRLRDSVVRAPSLQQVFAGEDMLIVAFTVLRLHFGDMRVHFKYRVNSHGIHASQSQQAAQGNFERQLEESYLPEALFVRVVLFSVCVVLCSVCVVLCSVCVFLCSVCVVLCAVCVVLCSVCVILFSVLCNLVFCPCSPVFCLCNLVFCPCSPVLGLFV